MKHVWYNIYYPASAAHGPAATIGIPPQGAFLWDTFVEGPDYPGIVYDKDCFSYAVRKDLDQELTDEEIMEQNTQWDDIWIRVKHGHI